MQTGRLETPESRERARAPDEDLVVTSRARNIGACPKDLEKKMIGSVVRRLTRDRRHRRAGVVSRR